MSSTIRVLVLEGNNKIEAEAFLGEYHIELLAINRQQAKWLWDWYWRDPCSSRRIKIKSSLDGSVVYSNYATLFNLDDRSDDTQSAIIFKDEFHGTNAVRIWRAHHNQESIWYTEESYLYSDATFVAELPDMGPFSVLNVVPEIEPPHGALVLRASVYQSLNAMRTAHPGDSKVSLANERPTSGYAEEIAALLSTLTGVRLHAGRLIRRFEPHQDCLGRPEYPGRAPYLPFKNPSVLPTYPQWAEPDLRIVAGDFLRYFALPLPEGSAFARACLLFQKALWYVDDDVETAWLRLVGACETLAACEPGASESDTHDLLPKELRDEDMSPKVRGYILRLGGATRKFLTLLKTYTPDPPACRPVQDYARVDWNNLEPVYKSIYQFRSDALHSGHSLPIPLIRRPEREQGVDACAKCGGTHYLERMVGKRGYGSTWFEPQSCPMHFHIFLYIVRGVLVNWLRKKSPDVPLAVPTA